MRKVCHSEITEHNNFNDVVFKNRHDYFSKPIRTKLKHEMGRTYHVITEYEVYVSEEVFSVGGFYMGYMNGKHLQFNIYY